MCQCQSEGRAVQPAAHDQDVIVKGHVAEYGRAAGIVHARLRRYRQAKVLGAHMQAWLKMTAADLGRGIACGEIDPVALTETYLQAIEGHPFKDRIYARVTADRARAEAEASARRAQSGHRLSLLDGVPISWKDLFDSAGVATEAARTC